MTQFTISRSGNMGGGVSGVPDFVRAITQSLAKHLLTGATAVTDNSTGVAGASVKLVGPFANVAASGANLATKASVDAGLAAVQNAVKTLFTVANGAAVKLGIAPVVYNGGGVDGAGTVGAIGTAVAGSATGPDAASSNAAAASVNAALNSLASLVGKIGIAARDGRVIVDRSALAADLPFLAAVPALVAATGPAGAPGVTAAAWQAALTAWANGVATLAAELNRINAVEPPKVLAVD